MKGSRGLVVLLSIFIFFNSCNNSSSTSGKQESQDSLAVALVKTDYLSECKTLYSAALHMDSVLLSETEIVRETANKAIKAFTDFAHLCASDSMSPVYLIKTAQV